jgi:hypothetical protein
MINAMPHDFVLSDKLLAQPVDHRNFDRRVLVVLQAMKRAMSLSHVAAALQVGATAVPVILTIWGVWWAGWAPTLRNEPFLTRLVEQLKAPRRFRIAA